MTKSKADEFGKIFLQRERTRARKEERQRETERERESQLTMLAAASSFPSTFSFFNAAKTKNRRRRRGGCCRCSSSTRRGGEEEHRRRRGKERINNNKSNGRKESFDDVFSLKATTAPSDGGGGERGGNEDEIVEAEKRRRRDGAGEASSSSGSVESTNNNNKRLKNRKERRRFGKIARGGDDGKEGSVVSSFVNESANRMKEEVMKMTSSSKESGAYEPNAASAARTTTALSKRSDDAAVEPEVVLTTDDMQQEGWAFTFPKSVDELSNTYQSAPARYKLMVCCACAFVVCNMDKINMSVAVIPMSREFAWDTAQSGILQSSFFYGFALSQIPGGFLNTKFGGARVLPLGLTFISLATLAIPFAGDNLPALFFARALVGLGEGVVPSAVTDIIARAMPVGERSRAVAFTFSGFNVGSILGLSVAPFIMEKTGWRGMFDIFGSFGALWIVLALGLFSAGGVTTRAIDEGKVPVTNLFGSRQEAESEPGKPKEEITFENVPWGQFANSDPIKALAFVHFVGNWGTYVVLAWLPTYFTQEVGLSLTNASLLTLLPPIANIAVGTLAGPTADGLIQRGTDLTLVRKGCQSVAFAAPAFAMLLSTYFEDPVATVILLTIGISFQSFSYAGLYSNHQDLSPKYASILLGITNTCGALPGVIGVPLTGYLIKETQEWELSMFGPAIILYSLGIAAYWKWGSGERLEFDKPKST